MPFVSVGQLNVYFEERGAGPPILFISGLGSDLRSWEPLLPFCSTTYRSITFDSRDNGSTSPAGGPYTISDMVEDAAGLLGALGVPRAHVVGASMGGAIAQELAIRRPDLVDHLVLLSTYTSSDPRGAAILESWLHLQRALPREAYLRAIYPWLFTVEEYGAPGLIEDVIQYALENRSQQSPEAYERQMQAALSHHSVGRLSAIRAPTLVLFGEDDILTPLRFAHSLMEEIPHVRLRTFPGAGHALVWTRTREVAEEILGFLAQSSG